MKRVLVTEPLHEVGMSLLQARPDVEVILAGDKHPETLAKLVPGVHAIAVRAAKLPAELLAGARDLEVVSRHGVGCDSVAVDHLSERGIPVAIASGANAASVAEHTMALILTTARHLPAQDAAVRGARFTDRAGLIATDLAGATLLIIGFGRVGRKVAPLARAFAMNVVVADIALDRGLAAKMGCRAVEDFRPELAGTDFVTLHVPLDDSTRHLLSKTEFDRLKRGAVLINCARGGVADEAAMIAALDSGRLAAAGLDVFSEEPPRADDPLLGQLLRRDDVFLTPHSAAASHGSMRAMSRMTAQNILDCFDQQLSPECVFNHDALARR